MKYVAPELTSSTEPEQKTLIYEEKIKCLNNQAATFMKLDRNTEAIESCEQVLKLDPSNAKAMFRKGQILSNLNEYADAISCLKQAVNLEPSNASIRETLSKAIEKYDTYKKSEKKVYSKMLRGASSIGEESSSLSEQLKSDSQPQTPTTPGLQPTSDPTTITSPTSAPTSQPPTTTSESKNTDSQSKVSSKKSADDEDGSKKSSSWWDKFKGSFTPYVVVAFVVVLAAFFFYKK